MPGWWRSRRSSPPGDLRHRQVVALARAVLAQVRAEGQPAAYLRSLEPFIELAPEVLALGPAPASLTMRVLYGLCSLEGETGARFTQTLAEEFGTPSPTLRAVLRSGLVELDPNGHPHATARGRDLFGRLVACGAFAGEANA